MARRSRCVRVGAGGLLPLLCPSVNAEVEMKTLTELTNDEIGLADWINAVDPQSGQWETLWGYEIGETTTRRQTSILDVLVEKGDDIGLLNLIDRVEAVRGRLPSRIAVKRENLRIASLLRPRAFTDEDLVITDQSRG
jgi:hypothetical protein